MEVPHAKVLFSAVVCSFLVYHTSFGSLASICLKL